MRYAVCPGVPRCTDASLGRLPSSLAVVRPAVADAATLVTEAA